MQSEIFTPYIFQVKKCNLKPVALLLHSSMFLPRSGFSREAAVLLRLTGALRRWGRGRVKCLSLHRHAEMGKTPQRISALLLSRQKIRLQLDRPLWISCFSYTRYWTARLKLCRKTQVHQNSWSKVSPPYCWVQRCTCRKQKLSINGAPASLLGRVGRGTNRCTSTSWK